MIDLKAVRAQDIADAADTLEAQGRRLAEYKKSLALTEAECRKVGARLAEAEALLRRCRNEIWSPLHDDAIDAFLTPPSGEPK
jgi:hypothetical protein